MTAPGHVDIPHSRPFVGEEEAAAVAAVVRSRQLAAGPKVRELEARWSRETGTGRSVAVGSGLGALRLALLALDVGRGDEVVLPAYGCVALLNATLALGAVPALADVDLDLWTLSVEQARRRLTPRTKAIVAVHLFGSPAPVDDLKALGPPLVEDCAHGIGGTCGGVPFGGAGTLSVGSFYATKMLAAGEGGVVAGRDGALPERVRRAREYADQPADGRRLNDKMSDIEAALVLQQLDRLPQMLARRAERARGYARLLAPLVERGWLALPRETPGRIWYRYAVRLVHARAEPVAAWLGARGVRAERPVFDLRGEPAFGPDLEVTSMAFDRLLSLPLYPDLSEEEQLMVTELLSACLERDPHPAEVGACHETNESHRGRRGAPPARRASEAYQRRDTSSERNEAGGDASAAECSSCFVAGPKNVSDRFARIAAFYDDLVERYGHVPRACDYGSPASQRAKFEVLAQVSCASGLRVLDIGCGFADFARYLRERFRSVEYTGLDLSPRMVEEARRLHPDLDLRVGNFLETPFRESFDLVTANGIFYLLDEDAPRLMREMVRRMFELARVAVAFNSLSSWARDPEPREFHADPLEVLAFCRELTPWCVLRHDYHPRDFTVYLYKRGPA